VVYSSFFNRSREGSTGTKWCTIYTRWLDNSPDRSFNNDYIKAGDRVGSEIEDKNMALPLALAREIVVADCSRARACRRAPARVSLPRSRRGPGPIHRGLKTKHRSSTHALMHGEAGPCSRLLRSHQSPCPLLPSMVSSSTLQGRWSSLLFFCLRGGPLVIIYFWMPAGDEDISR
jgi:hypothetical protein